jgi:hypothetical protein
MTGPIHPHFQEHTLQKQTPMFSPDCLPVLIGSLPLSSHRQAVELIFRFTPEIPLWPQLPALSREGMVRQFIDGFPGLIDHGRKYWVDSDSDDFPGQMASFYEEFFIGESQPHLPDVCCFSLPPDTARGFFTFTEMLEGGHYSPVTVKGQVTGPVTTGIGVRDHRGAVLLHDDNLRDILVKLLGGKARWQVERLKRYCAAVPPLVFIDEPGMVSFGSTAFAGISRELASETVSPLIASIKGAGGLAGIHICANGDWEPALASGADIISFDAYSYFDHFILYRDHLASFLESGGILAWGIVPTSDPDAVVREQVESLYEAWKVQLEALCSLGFTSQYVVSRSLIAPACGTGSLSPGLAEKVLSMTRGLADRIRSDFALSPDDGAAR